MRKFNLFLRLRKKTRALFYANKNMRRRRFTHHEKIRLSAEVFLFNLYFAFFLYGIRVCNQLFFNFIGRSVSGETIAHKIAMQTPLRIAFGIMYPPLYTRE